MSPRPRFERRLEGMVSNAFARLFKGKVHPAEIARALQREAEEKRVVVGEHRVLVPNRYVVVLGQSDYAHLAEWERQLTQTLADMVHEYVSGEGWSTFGRISVSFSRKDSLRTGVFSIESGVDADAGPAQPAQSPAGQGYAAAAHPPPGPPPHPQQPPQPPQPPAQPGAPDAGPPTAAWTPEYAPPAPAHVIVVDGPNTRYPLTEGSNVVGRGHDARVRLPDTGVSRRHVDIVVSGPSALARDMDSTNGTIINGQRRQTHQLQDGDVLRIGHSVLVYRRELNGAGQP